MFDLYQSLNDDDAYLQLNIDFKERLPRLGNRTSPQRKSHDIGGLVRVDHADDFQMYMDGLDQPGYEQLSARDSSGRQLRIQIHEEGASTE